MSYQKWLKQYNLKRQNILDKLSHLTKDEVIKYFDFENMKKEEPEFCPLYKDNQKCHDTQNLNCYFCACPEFKVDDTKSFCIINSKYGSTTKDKNGFIHQDCSSCLIPHNEKYIKKNFTRHL
jgi:Zn-finger protein